MTTTESAIAGELPPVSDDSPRSTRGFWALIATQFQGAYSDNILRGVKVLAAGLEQTVEA